MFHGGRVNTFGLVVVGSNFYKMLGFFHLLDVSLNFLEKELLGINPLVKFAHYMGKTIFGDKPILCLVIPQIDR